MKLPTEQRLQISLHCAPWNIPRRLIYSLCPRRWRGKMNPTAGLDRAMRSGQTFRWLNPYPSFYLLWDGTKVGISAWFRRPAQIWSMTANSVRALNMSCCIPNPHPDLVPFPWPWFWPQRRNANDQSLHWHWSLALLPGSPLYLWWEFKNHHYHHHKPPPEPSGVCRASQECGRPLDSSRRPWWDRGYKGRMEWDIES